MPVISVEVPTLTKEQKRMLVKENDRDNIGVAGMLLADRDEQNSPE